MTFPNLSLTSPHVTGANVKSAQTLLKTNRWGTSFFPDAIDGDFGPLTAAACHRAKFWLGYPTKSCTQDFGPELYGYLTAVGHPGYLKLPILNTLRRKSRLKAPKPVATFRTKALALSKTFLGYEEKPVNLTIFGAWYGFNGEPWCAMFVSYCLSKSGKAFKLAYVPTIVSLAEQDNGMYLTSQPIPGDLICYDWDNNGLFDHVEFFDSWADQAAGTFHTVGGNTLPPGGTGNQSNGGGVYANVRGTRQGYNVKFVRVKD